jgi:hypothetical protein
MKIDRVKNEFSVNIRIYPFSEIGSSTFECNTAVTVHQTMSFGPDRVWNDAKVDWPAIGSTTATRAKLFAEAIALACAEAEKLNERKGQP